MKKGKNVKKISLRCVQGKNKTLDFYMTINGNEMRYAFSRRYSAATYDLCKSGILTTDLMKKRTRNKSVMYLVKYVEYIMPYLEEYYDLSA